MSERCRICGASDKQTHEVSPGEIGQGLLCTPVSLCEFCAQLVDAPHQDGCLICGSDDTHFSFEIEGVSGADSLDTYYGGSLCTECSHDMLLEVQTRAMDSKAGDDEAAESQSARPIPDGGRTHEVVIETGSRDAAEQVAAAVSDRGIKSDAVSIREADDAE